MGRVKISTEIESNATPHEQFVSMCQFINDYQTKLPNNKSGAIRQGALVFDEKGVYQPVLDKNAEPVIDPSVLKLAQPISIDYTEYLKFKSMKEKPQPRTLVVSRRNHSSLHANYYKIVREEKQKDQFSNREYTTDEKKAIFLQMKQKNRVPVGATEQNRKIAKW